MTEARHHELRRVADGQRALATAAARPDPVPAVLHALAVRLDGRAVLYTPGGRQYAADGRDLTPEEGAALARLVRRAAGAARRPSSAADTAGGTRLVAYGLGTGVGRGLTLGLAMARRGRGGPAARGDRDGAAVAADRPAPGSRRGDPLGRARTAPAGGPARGGGAAAGRGALDGGARAGRRPRRPCRPRWAARSWTRRRTGPCGCCCPPGGSRRRTRAGASGRAPPAAPGDLAAADAQAARALRRAEAAHTGLVRHRAGGLAALVDEEEAAAHALPSSRRSRRHRRSRRPCGPGCRCTAAGTARRRHWGCTATRCGSGSPGARRCWTRTWTTRRPGWSCGSRCGGGDAAARCAAGVRRGAGAPSRRAAGCELNDSGQPNRPPGNFD